MLVAIIRIIIAAHGIARDRKFQITLLLFLSHIEANTDATAFSEKPFSGTTEKKVSDEEELLSIRVSHHARQPSKPFETDIPIDLGDLLKNP
ncbi:hypothetical protein PMIN03_008934 [Paraphaeosphaeria minitans]